MNNNSRKHKTLIILILIVIMFIISSLVVKKLFSLGKNLTQPENAQSTSEYMKEDNAWNLVLTNKWNPLPENRNINLVEIEGGERVDERIKEPLMKMLEDAKSENLNQLPKVVSGYRTMEEQQKLYEDKINEYRREGCSETTAKNMAEEWVAVPGTKTDITGVAEEVWHYRYVGVDAATEIYEQGICLEEYLEEQDQKPE